MCVIISSAPCPWCRRGGGDERSRERGVDRGGAEKGRGDATEELAVPRVAPVERRYRQSAYTCDGERFDNTHLHLIADHLLRALEGSLRTKVQEPTNDPAASEEDPRLAKHCATIRGSDAFEV